MSADEFRRTLTMKGVNAELRPFIHMTAPSEWAERPIAEWPLGQEVFSSWILLFAIVPVDRHKFYLKSADPQNGFQEESSSLSNSLWRHRRHIVEDGQSCVLTDSLELQSRIASLTALLAPIYRFVFEHRHRVLRSRYDGELCAFAESEGSTSR